MSNRTIFHIDVNSAYLSWEAAYRLQHGDEVDLRSIPSVIGGDPSTRHGIVLAKSIPAKKFSIKTGETLFTARQKCPNLVVAPPNYLLYHQCSLAMRDILLEYSPSIQQFSVDEYFLDDENRSRLHTDPLHRAHEIKDRIKQELGFTVNIGISSNKLLAKMASDFEKPDKVHTLFPDEIPVKLWPLPIEELFMVGRASAKKLRARGILTIGELAHRKPEDIRRFLNSFGLMLWNYANGYQDTAVRTDPLRIKGMGNSTTIAFDVVDRPDAHLVLLSLSEMVGMRLRQEHFNAQQVVISLRTNEFASYSHQVRLYTPTNCTNDIYHIACKLFDEVWQGQPVRHLGVGVSKLSDCRQTQMALFDKFQDNQRRVDQAMDVVRKKYGVNAILRSAFLNSGIKPVNGGVPQDDAYPMMTSIL